MNPFAPLAAALALSMSVVATTASAADIGPQPADFESAATAYIESRLDNPRMAEIRTVSEPYAVTVSHRGRELACWAVDMRVKADLPGGGFSRFAAVTVLFHDGQPFATRDDVARFSRLDDGVRVAGN